jgi:hypothetical protein
MSGQPSGEHEGEKRDQATQAGEAGTLSVYNFRVDDM